MRKKLAIETFGHVRNYVKSYRLFFKNLVLPIQNDGYDVDIFIHTWNEVDHNTVSYRNDGKKNITFERVDINRLSQIYNPRKILVEDQLNIDDEILTEKLAGSKRSLKGVYNNVYTVHKVDELRQEYECDNNVRYDWIIQTRLDVVFLQPFKIESFFKIYNDLNIFIPENAIFFGHNIFNGGNINVADPHLVPGTDLFYMSNGLTMQKATSFYENFQNNFRKDDFWTLEIMWMDYWKKRELLPIALNYKYRRDFVLTSDVFKKKLFWDVFRCLK